MVSNKKEKKSNHSMARKQREEEENAEVEGQSEECPLHLHGPTAHFIFLNNSSKMTFRFS